MTGEAIQEDLKLPSPLSHRTLLRQKFMIVSTTVPETWPRGLARALGHKTESLQSLSKETGFVFKSEEKFKPRGTLKNNDVCGKRQLGGDL